MTVLIRQQHHHRTSQDEIHLREHLVIVDDHVLHRIMPAPGRDQQGFDSGVQVSRGGAIRMIGFREWCGRLTPPASPIPHMAFRQPRFPTTGRRSIKTALHL